MVKPAGLVLSFLWTELAEMNDPIPLIKQRLETINQRIAYAAQTSGRKPADVKLLVVTKKQPVKVIENAIQAGISLFGENYPEEAVEKINLLNRAQGLHWHMIGHLQSRKVRLVAEYFDMFHALDSLELAEKLERTLDVTGKILPVLLEVNIGGELTKGGWEASDQARWDSLLKDFTQIINLPHLHVGGLMAMPPLLAEREDVRPYFTQVRSLQQYLKKVLPTIEWKELSMGTSHDFEIAIQEGATYVRIGEAIFGARPV
jgi:PLP dependent protein